MSFQYSQGVRSNLLTKLFLRRLSLAPRIKGGGSCPPTFIIRWYLYCLQERCRRETSVVQHSDFAANSVPETRTGDVRHYYPNGLKLSKTANEWTLVRSEENESEGRIAMKPR